MNQILLGKGKQSVHLNLGFANRHGLIAGATGTGKTVSLQVLAEGFSRAGVPVFLADVKGDLSGLHQAGSPHQKIDERVARIGIEDYEQEGFPTVFWDLQGQKGHPIRATVSDMGPMLLARLLDLNDTQEGILNIAFKFADDEGLLLLDFKDLCSILEFMSEHPKDFSGTYGNVSRASIGAIQRDLLVLERQGAEQFFGEPALDLWSFMRTGAKGYGQINVLSASQLMQSPRLYSCFLLWLLSELFESLPEVGDPDKPKLVFFFDEAHLLFDQAPKALLEKIEQVVKLIRSKGVGVYFITQNPLDIPDAILGQLGNRIQHALRAFTPRDQKAVKAAAETFRANPAFDTQQVIGELAVGEALVSTLMNDGVPSMVEKSLMCPPRSLMGGLDAATMQQAIAQSPLAGRYDTMIDRESAHELLSQRSEAIATEVAQAQEKQQNEKTQHASSRRQGLGEAVMKSFVRSVSSSFGRRIGTQIVRGLLGSIFKGR